MVKFYSFAFGKYFLINNLQFSVIIRHVVTTYFCSLTNSYTEYTSYTGVSIHVQTIASV